jgi:hypothetical protein
MRVSSGSIQASSKVLGVRAHREVVRQALHKEGCNNGLGGEVSLAGLHRLARSYNANIAPFIRPPSSLISLGSKSNENGEQDGRVSHPGLSAHNDWKVVHVG